MEFDENEPEPIATPDTPNKTRFNPEEAKEPRTQRKEIGLLTNRNYQTNRRQFEMFRRVNQGRTNRCNWGGDPGLEQKMDRMQRFDSIASQLDMTPYQRGMGRIVRNSESLRRCGYPDEYVAFCLCSFICRNGKYARRTPQNERKVYHPDRSDENNDMRFVELADKLDLRPHYIRKCMGKMANKLPSHLSWN